MTINCEICDTEFNIRIEEDKEFVHFCGRCYYPQKYHQMILSEHQPFPYYCCFYAHEISDSYRQYVD